MSAASEDPSSVAAHRPERPVRALLRNGSFLSVWLVGGLTGIVRWLLLLVLGIYTFQITRSPLLVSMVPMLWMIPLALCGPLLGVLAERVDRKILLAGGLGLVTATCLGAAWTASVGGLAFLQVAILSVLNGLFWAMDMPVRRRLLGDLAGAKLSEAMSLDSATGNATRMAGPLLGGVILQLFSITGVFLFSAAIFSLCIVLVVTAELPRSAPRTSSSIFLRELVAGLRFVKRSPPLRRIFAVTIAFNIWGFPFTSMIPVIGTARLGLDPFMVGVLSSTEGMGAFIGAILVAFLARPQWFFSIYLWGTVGYLALIGYLGALTFLAGGPLHSFLAAMVTLVSIGICGACFAAMQGTLTYLEAAPEYRSRVLGVLTLCIGTGPIGFFKMGWMAETFGVPAALMLASAEGLLVLVILWAFSKDPEPGATSG